VYLFGIGSKRYKPKRILKKRKAIAEFIVDETL
jgi:hypothetical protein